MTYSNVQALFDYHWRAGLKPKVDPVMEAVSNWLLPRGTTVEVNRDEYVRPGPLERAQTDQILFNIQDPATGGRAKELAEIRELERFGLSAPSPTLTQGVLQ